MNKYRNYFSSPKSEIVKDVLGFLIIGGMVVIAATSPFFVVNLARSFKKFRKYPHKKVYDTFYKLKERGFVNFYEKNNQIYISLTERGKKKAGWLQIDDLRIIKPKKWDGKWRILLFDIAEMKRTYREALRGKLKELGFQLFQKSAWINPYDCAKEVNLLKSFFGLNGKEAKLVISQDIGDDKEFRKFFKV
ncbi:MAG: hypothetical protein NT155_01615 [Candidatus Staskawiczbacteria bacterium]|nr:hypothetical protein [Candidatus Staskawiczbacteria bacterium]